MATLQNMEFQGDFELYSNICIVDEIRKGGEFTVCGLAIPDSTLETDGFRAVNKEYKGSIKECTCPNCRRIIAYYKNLK